MELVKDAVPNAEGVPKSGVRGWLLLLVLWLGVIDPLYSLALNGFFAGRWEALGREPDVTFWGPILARETARILAALLLWLRRDSHSVWIALAIVWLSGPIFVLATWTTQVMPDAFIRSTAVALLVTGYLFRSERVRATYNFRTKS
jgi:hypothetical protein